MIPHKLRLHNFMCYRDEQCLDFGGIHLACLAGDNGHGKSALLDAMTWAIWGKARTRRDDELIALGETEMWVDFQFALGPQKYRILRQRSRKGRGQSDLHFYIWHQVASEPCADDCWRLLDEGGLADRQALIIRTLRMEYDTFVNSAFLLQGRADSFTVKTPSERKQVLGDILGLERYDLYEERAKAEIQRLKSQAEQMQGEMLAIDRELARRPTYEAQLQTARAKVAAAGNALRAAQAELQTVRLAVQNAEEQERRLDDLRRRLARTQRDLDEGQQQLSAARTRLREFEAVLVQRDEIEAGWAALQTARQEDAVWNSRLVQHTALQEQMNRARLAIDGARITLETERRRCVERQQELARKAASARDQATTLMEVQQILAMLTAQQARREELAGELREVAERIAALRVENDRFKIEGTALREKMEMLRASEAAACPLCRQPLTVAHRDEMLVAFGSERDHLAAQFQANQAEMKALAEQKQALEAEDLELARELRALPARQRQAAQAEAAVAEGEAAAAEAAEMTQQVEQLTARLEAKDYALAEQSELARLEAEQATSGYDSAAHETVRNTVASLEPFAVRYQRQLLAALDGVEAARAEVDMLAAQQERRETELREDQAQIERMSTVLRELADLKSSLERANRELESAAADERRARQEEGAAMQQLSVLDTLAARYAELTAQQDAINRESSIFAQLREAFGKKGLQAMIIESAIPEVETEANRLLARMSQGRMSLRLETQREKVTGGIAETLDIIISDELGARPYETYSGGEAFRANLALRIAISKLLARRAGAQLQTLVIDEGFGTQDSQGRALLVEAINSIQHDFERIIVITHIEELRDLFPARIDVVKTPGGSRISIA